MKIASLETGTRRRSVITSDREADSMYQMLRTEDVRKQESATKALARYTVPFPGLDAQTSFLNPIPPTYSPALLRDAVKNNNTLMQCFAAIVTNCHLVGGSFKFIGENDADKDKPEMIKERDNLSGLADYPNGKTTMRQIREKFGWDNLMYGYSFLEVGRGIDGLVNWYRHAPSENTYLCGLDPELVETNRPVYRNGVLTDLQTKEKFRRFVQINGNTKTYFKEFGDPRLIDPATGLRNDKLSLADSATEIIHVPNLPVTLYGSTEWENNLPAVLGSREAEIVNVEFFRDGGMPALVVLVSGGSLTSDAVTDIENKFNQGKAKDKMLKAVILEATGDASLSPGIDGAIPAPKVDIKELGQNMEDGLFQEYDKNCSRKVRTSVRLPAIFIGESDDYNYATAVAAIETTENQVFGPKRQTFDDVLNNLILAKEGLASKNWAYVSNGVKISDPATVISALSALATAGAIDPNTAVDIYNNLFNAKLTPKKEAWADLPMQLVTLLLNAEKAAQMVGEEAAASVKDLQTKFGATPKPAPVLVPPGSKPKLLPPPNGKKLPIKKPA